jgi:predicted PurR-regulated permease PerM
MYTGLLHTHSFLRWILLAVLIAAVAYSLYAWLAKKSYTKGHDRLASLSLIFSHTQFLIGLILYFISPIVQSGLQDMGAAMKNAEIRFWVVEHLVGMVVAVALVTIGRIASRKKDTDPARLKTQAIYFTIALVLMLLMIPWERFNN